MPPKPQTLKEIKTQMENEFNDRFGFGFAMTSKGKVYMSDIVWFFKQFTETNFTQFAESVRMQEREIGKPAGLWTEGDIGYNEAVKVSNTKLDNFLKGGGV